MKTRDRWEIQNGDILRSDPRHKQLKYLWVYSAANLHVVDWHDRLIKSRNAEGYDVEAICNTFPDDGYQWYPFNQLDEMWEKRNCRLMELYERIAAAMRDRDVLVLYNGANLHPDFVRQLNGVKVYTFGDPESWDHLAGPMAGAFDIHFANQFSEIGKLKKLGLKHVYFCPLGTKLLAEDMSSNEEEILRPRSIPAALFCGRTSWRNDRLDTLASNFPEALIRGEGWPGGRISHEGMHDAYQNASVGWNVHNTTGFCFRTYDLAAYGVMQLCDCMEDLNRIFEVGEGREEVIGYTSIHDCIDKTRFYLSHIDDQREIALRAWNRCKQAYTPNAVWDYMTRRIALACYDIESDGLSGGAAFQNPFQSLRSMMSRNIRGLFSRHQRH